MEETNNIQEEKTISIDFASKQEEYAVKLANHIMEIFEPGGKFSIDRNDLEIGDNFTHFMHCVSNLAPRAIFESMTNDQIDSLSFNHLANRLVMQYSGLMGEETPNNPTEPTQETTPADEA
jgi:hypothetical protein